MNTKDHQRNSNAVLKRNADEMEIDHPGQKGALFSFSVGGSVVMPTQQICMPKQQILVSPVMVHPPGMSYKAPSMHCKELPGKSYHQHPRTDLSKKRKARKKWTPSEDKALAKAIQPFIKEDVVEPAFARNITWSTVADSLGTSRNSKQCRDRWQNYLRPGIKKGGWTREEEEMIKDMFQTFGPKWCAMSKLLKNRSDNDIKNKWYSMARKRKRLNDKLQQAIFPERERYSTLQKASSTPNTHPGAQYSHKTGVFSNGNFKASEKNTETYTHV